MSEIIKKAFENIDPKAKQRVDKMIKDGSESLNLFDVSRCTNLKNKTNGRITDL